MKEDYVSYEVAKLLKEKGFDNIELDLWYLQEQGKECFTMKAIPHYELRYFESKGYNYYPCPTQQMAMQWLREVAQIHIITLPYAPIDRPPYHPGEADIVYIAQIFRGIIPLDEVGRSIIKLTPEDAYEEAIKYCLENLI